MHRTLLATLLLLVACDKQSSTVVPPAEHVATTSAPACPEPPTPPSATAVVAPGDPLADVTLAARPEWMDRYAKSNKGDMRFFDIVALMAKHRLPRDRAVELQNHYRDLSRSDPGAGPQVWFDQALERATKGEFEDRRDLDKLREAPFIVVLDLDETLYDQSYPPAVAERCHDLEVTQGDKTRRIKIAPGATELIDRAAALGGAVVIFSANVDDKTLANLRAWTFGGKPMPEHPAISGVLTNSHLVLQRAEEGSSAALEPAKDLRIFDESLRRVIIVDDNPLRTFQPANVRLVPKFDAERYCETGDTKLHKSFDRTLSAVADEIEESVRWMRSKSADFATAYLPYTQTGVLAVELLQNGGMSRRAAIDYVRTHPNVVEREF